MDSFFRRVLPAGGSYSLLTLNKKVPRDLNGISTIEDLSAAVQKLSTRPLDIYYAVGSFNGDRLAANAFLKRAIFLDLDGKDFGGKEQVLPSLKAFVRSVGIPEPSIVVDSGGGYHVYWTLDQELDAAGWSALALALKHRCRSAGFPADPTVTADAARVLRVPGTLNHKYNPPIPVRLVSDSGVDVSPVGLLRQLVEQGAEGVLGHNTRPAAVDINDDLGAGLEYEKIPRADLEAMLACIKLPDDLNCRDAWWRILCGIRDWDDGQAGLEVADTWSQQQPRYKSTADVAKTFGSFNRDAGPRTTVGTIVHLAREAGYKAPEAGPDEDAVPINMGSGGFLAEVVRADVRAVESLGRGGRNRLSLDEARAELTGDFLYVENQGTYYSKSRRNVLDKVVIDDLYYWKMPRNSDGRVITATTILKSSPNTGQVFGLGFHPGKGFLFDEDGRSYVNKHVPAPDEVTPTKNEVLLFNDLVNYLFPRQEDQTFKRYWMQFMAHMVQRPGVKIATALLFISEKQGIGKTLAMYDIPRLLVGTHNAQKVTNDDLESRFTGYLGDAHLLHLEEVHVNGHWSSSKIANKLKAVITDAHVRVEQKGLDVYNIPNRLVVTATSNYRDAMYISGRQERRWGIYELAPTRGYSAAQHRTYFNLIHSFLSAPRAAGVLRYIFNRIPLVGFDPQTPPPITTAKDRMAILSMPEHQQIILEAAQLSQAPFHRDFVTIEEVRGLIKQETGKMISGKEASQHMQRCFPECFNKQVRLNAQAAPRFWVWRNQDQWERAMPDKFKEVLALDVSNL